MNARSCKKAAGTRGKQVTTKVQLVGISKADFSAEVQEWFKTSFANTVQARLRQSTGKADLVVGPENLDIVEVQDYEEGGVGDNSTRRQLQYILEVHHRALADGDSVMVTVVIQPTTGFDETGMDQLDAAKDELLSPDFSSNLISDFNARLGSEGTGLNVSAVTVPKVTTESTGQSERLGCTTGYTGMRCGVCDEALNYVRAGVSCAKCWSSAANAFIVWLIILIFCALVYYLCYYGSALSSASHDHSVVFRITINFLQMIGLMGIYKIGGTDNLKALFNIASSTSGVSLTFAPIQCYLGWSYYQRFAFYMGVPVIVLVMPFLMLLPKFLRIWGILEDKLEGSSERKLSKIDSFRKLKKAWGKYYSTFSFLIFLLYQGVIQQNLSIFRCYDSSGTSGKYLIDDFTIRCDNATYYLAVVIGVCFLVIYSFGIPFFIWQFLRRNRHRMAIDPATQKPSDPHFNKCFSFIYNGYKPERFYWESVLMFRKFGVVAIASFVQNEFYQIFFSTTLVVLFLILHLNYLPYENRTLNSLETMMLLAVYFTQIACLAFAMNPDKDKCEPERDCDAATMVTVFVTIMNLVVLLTLIGYASKRMKENFGWLGETVNKTVNSTVNRFATHASWASDDEGKVEKQKSSQQERMTGVFSGSGSGTDSSKSGESFKSATIEFDESDVYVGADDAISQSQNPMHAEGDMQKTAGTGGAGGVRRSHAGPLSDIYSEAGVNSFTGDVNPHFVGAGEDSFQADVNPHFSKLSREASSRSISVSSTQSQII
jgi:hypothetical protein